MQIRADAEDEVDLDIRVALGEAAKQRLAIAALGGREQRQAFAWHGDTAAEWIGLRRARNAVICWAMNDEFLRLSAARTQGVVSVQAKGVISDCPA